MERFFLYIFVGSPLSLIVKEKPFHPDEVVPSITLLVN
jgi:hypothetical protein